MPRSSCCTKPACRKRCCSSCRRGLDARRTLLTQPDIAGVCFTGSTETAWTINRTLAARNAPIAALIAETGGQNALIADSSALPEQLVKDAITSAFDSAGQRCSAARVLFVQEDIADKVIEMLSGAMDELVVGDPALLSTDVGPVIDAALVPVARRARRAHGPRSQADQRRSSCRPVPSTARSSRRAPTRSSRCRLLTQEVFGPVLHVIR